jgi:DNA topoisomerase-2
VQSRGDLVAARTSSLEDAAANSAPPRHWLVAAAAAVELSLLAAAGLQRCKPPPCRVAIRAAEGTMSVSPIRTLSITVNSSFRSLCRPKFTRSFIPIRHFNNYNHKTVDKPFEPNMAGDTSVMSNVSIDKYYQKMSHREQILMRPSMYIGAVEENKSHMWGLNPETKQLEHREYTYVPGLLKIFDEIIVNAADNKQRDPKMNSLKVNIDKAENKISIFNNGHGIHVSIHKKEKMYIPTMIFGHLLTSSNYNDAEKRTVGGLNGYGAKLCNVFSTKFIVETCHDGKKFKQTWKNNMSEAGEPIVNSSSTADFTRVTFYPDLKRFGMSELTDDTIAIMMRRAYDIAGTLSGVNVCLNDEKLPYKGFKDYVKQYLGDTDFAYEECENGRWQVALAPGDGDAFKQVSFVNNIATTRGGKHVDYVCDLILDPILEVVKKKNKEKSNIKKPAAKKHMFLFVNALIENPDFDSQCKEYLNTTHTKFGSKCELTDKFHKKAQKIGVVESILSAAQVQARSQLESKSGRKTGNINVPKLLDAAYAGKQQSKQCTLILTEGDSAKGLAVSGTSVIGQHYYGVFPLRGKLLNVREAKSKQMSENAEINALIKILGLSYKKTYQNPEDLKDLRYGKIMIMTDQDADGSHIKGLIINFIHSQWPALIRHHSFFQQFITPIVKARKGNQTINFYSIPEFNEWKENTRNYNTYHIKYYKGLGTSTASEAKEYFSDLDRHRIDFKYSGKEDDNSIILAFSKDMIEARKKWLMDNMENRKRRRELGLPDVYLYEKNTREVTYHDFVNKELVLFSNLDNERSIPSVMDGLKPGQRKVIFTCFVRNDKREVKVAQLAGSVAERSAYHHGEASLQATIVNLAQDFVGSNNINLLQPIGQFGTRLRGGKDAASARYINTMLNTLTRKIFRPEDDPILNYLEDDNLKVEPEFYAPIIPMVLVNGAEGIGTGWSTKVPMYNPLDVIANVRRLIKGDLPEPMVPWYRDFRGRRDQIGSTVVISGVIRKNMYEPEQLEITELPIGVWTENYVESVLKPPTDATVKPNPAAPYNFVEDLVNYPDDTYVKMSFRMPENKLRDLETQAGGLYKAFKLQTTISLNSMVLFDPKGCLKRYETATEILNDFYEERRKIYVKRREYIIGMLRAEAEKLENHARYIDDKSMFEYLGTRPPLKALIQRLIDRGYAPDPVRRWKKSLQKDAADEAEERTEAETDGVSQQDIFDYAYLIDTPVRQFTAGDSSRLYKKRDEKRSQVEKITRSTIEELWLEDLQELEVAYNDWLVSLQKLRKEAREARGKAQKVDSKSRGKKAMVKSGGPEPSEDFQDVEPPLRELKEPAKTNGRGKGVKAAAAAATSNGVDDDDDDVTEIIKETNGTRPAKKAKAPAGAAASKKAATSKAKQASSKKKYDWETDSDEEETTLFLDDSSEDEILPTSKRTAPSSQTNGDKKPKLDDSNETDIETIE